MNLTHYLLQTTPATPSAPDFLDFVWRYGLAFVTACWFMWAVVVSDPPRFVRYRELEEAQEKLKEKEEELKAMTAQRDRLREQVYKATNLAGKALETAKAQSIEDSP